MPDACSPGGIRHVFALPDLAFETDIWQPEILHAENAVRALQCLIEDPKLRLRQGQAARQVLEQRYDASRNADQLLNLMKQISARA